MTIQQCKYALEVARRGSFGVAAQHLFVAQTSISTGIKALETELGIQIFERSNKGVHLTQEGTEFLHYAAQLVSQAEMIDERYRTSAHIAKLTVSCQHYDFAADVFGRFLNEIHDTAFTFSLRETRTYQVIEDVETAMADIGIIAICEKSEPLMERFLAKKKIVFAPLGTTKPHVFVRREHPLSGRGSIAPEELYDFPYIYYEQGMHNASFFTEELWDSSNQPRRIEITDRASLMNLLLLTNSYTIGTGIMTSELNGGAICAVPFASNSVYHLGYLVKKDKALSDHAQRFLTRLSAFFQNIEG